MLPADWGQENAMSASEPRQQDVVETGARPRLAEIERELARLRYRHDIAMSAFRFEEATALGARMAALEREQQALTAALPPPPAGGEAPTGVIPTLDRPRRRRR
jgi:hypothetical protein